MATVELQPVMIYIGLAIVGIFSGFGNSMGNYFFNEYWKPHVMEKLKIKLRSGLDNDAKRIKKVIATVNKND